jgi:hypothetical protein
MRERITQLAAAARYVTLLVTVSCLVACGQGAPTSANSNTAAATPTTQPPSSTTTSVNLTLSGTPATSVVAGSAYSFQPTASESSGTATFSITGTPAWATFNTTTGALTGSPTAADEGTTGAIAITASDGGTTASMAPFTIDVTAPATPPPTTGSATLSWVAPTENTDGTTVTDLAGFRIYYGTNAAALTQTIDVPEPSVTTYVIGNLAADTYFFAVAAYTTTGTESALSNIASKTM